MRLDIGYLNLNLETIGFNSLQDSFRALTLSALSALNLAPIMTTFSLSSISDSGLLNSLLNRLISNKHSPSVTRRLMSVLTCIHSCPMSICGNLSQTFKQSSTKLSTLSRNWLWRASSLLILCSINLIRIFMIGTLSQSISKLYHKQRCG